MRDLRHLKVRCPEHVEHISIIPHGILCTWQTEYDITCRWNMSLVIIYIFSHIVQDENWFS